MKYATEILDHRMEVLAFLKSRFPLYHQSNVFFRDIQYGIQLFLDRKGIKSRYPQSERIAHEFVSTLEREGVLRGVDRQSWALNYPEFLTPRSKPVPAARPAAPAPSAARPPAAKPAPDQETA
jgi:hypothetical protein